MHFIMPTRLVKPTAGNHDLLTAPKPIPFRNQGFLRRLERVCHHYSAPSTMQKITEECLRSFGQSTNTFIGLLLGYTLRIFMTSSHHGNTSTLRKELKNNSFCQLSAKLSRWPAIFISLFQSFLGSEFCLPILENSV